MHALHITFRTRRRSFVSEHKEKHIKKRMISSYNKNAFTEETEEVFIGIIMDVLN